MKSVNRRGVSPSGMGASCSTLRISYPNGEVSRPPSTAAGGPADKR